MAKPKQQGTVKEETVEDIMQQEEVKEEAIEEKPKQPREISINEQIPVRSVTEGGLIYVDPQTNQRYIWDKYGSVLHITFEKISNMYASYPQFLTEPYIVIDDKDVIEKLHLEYVYNEFNFEVADNLDKFFTKSVNEMRNIIRKLPTSIKENLKTKARMLYTNNKLSDLNKIQMLQEELKIDLRILSSDGR